MKLPFRADIVSIVLLLILQFANAQKHQNTWFRTTLDIPISPKFKSDFELQHRRQNNLENDNPLDKNLMYTFRTWLYFKKNKDVLFSLSPFAYFVNHKIIEKPSDAIAQPMHEYRFTAAVELQNQLRAKWFLVHRTALEYRVFEGAVTNTSRLRNKLGLKYETNSKSNITIGDEVLINTSGVTTAHIFDHNRLFTNFTYHLHTDVKIDLGYIYISRLAKHSLDVINENNFYLNLTYVL